MFQNTIKFRHTMAVIPAVIFWAVSLVFFVLGLSFDDHTGYLKWIGIALAVANTIIQMIGWDTEPNELGPLLFYTWIASYILGIGTNLVSLITILQINNPLLEWIVAGSLSFLIEVTPERLFVLAWRSLNPKKSNTFTPLRPVQGPRHHGQSPFGNPPPGVSRKEWNRHVQAELQKNAQQRKTANAQHKPAHTPRPVHQEQMFSEYMTEQDGDDIFTFES